MIPLRKYERVDQVSCVYLVDKVNLIESISPLTHQLTNHYARSQNPLKECLHLCYFKMFTCVWFHFWKYETVDKLSCVWIMNKVDLIESLLYHLLTNLTTSKIAAHSRSPLKKCLNLWCFKTVTCIWFHCRNMKEFIKFLVSEEWTKLIWLSLFVPITYQFNNRLLSAVYRYKSPLKDCLCLWYFNICSCKWFMNYCWWIKV